MLAFFALVSALFVAPLVQAAPSKLTGCDLSQAKITMLDNQATLAKPTGVPTSVSLGVGVQNYTCTAGTFTSTGAVAELFDASCAASKPEFSKISGMAFDMWNKIPANLMSAQQMIDMLAKIPFPPVTNSVLGQHYFVSTGNSTAPKWDYSVSKGKGKTNAFVIGAKDAALPAPKAADDVPWLELHGVQGELSKKMYRVFTRGGQPPKTCEAGAKDISVKYAAVYVMY